jgi:hypothetical protein
LQLSCFLGDGQAALGPSSSRGQPNGIPDFQPPPPSPKFIDTSQSNDELPFYDSFEPLVASRVEPTCGEQI